MNEQTQIQSDQTGTLMTDSMVNAEIDRLLAGLDGELSTHSRVVDALLDLRQAADDVRLVAVIEESLRSVPGRSTVPNEWFKTQLTTFRLMSDPAEPQTQN